MKFIIAVVCTLAASVAPAAGAIFAWDGGGSSGNYSWQTAANWRNDTAPGCSSSGTDNIVINAGNLVTPFNQIADWDLTSGNACAYGTVDVQSNGSYAMTLRKSGTGTFSGGAMSLLGHSASFEAHLDVDESMTADSLKAQGYADIDVASAKTLDINGSFSVDAISGLSTCEKLAAGGMTPDTLYVLGGNSAGEHATFVISDGNVTASAASTPFTSIEAADSVDADATLQFNGTGDTLGVGTLYIRGGNPSTGGLSLFDFNAGTLTNPDGITLSGLSKIDAEHDITVNGELSVTVNGGDGFATEATIDPLDSGAVLSVEKIVIGGGQACKLTIIGGASLSLETDGDNP